MSVHDSKRTLEVIDKLVKIGNILRFCIIASTIIFLIILLVPMFGYDNFIFAIVIGGVLGFFIGKIVASFTTISIEWMAQLLVIQEESLLVNKEQVELFRKITTKKQPKKVRKETAIQNTTKA